MSTFHLAYTVSDLDSARKFYGDLLGCREGRSTESWVDFDFFGNQLSLHIGQTIKGLILTLRSKMSRFRCRTSAVSLIGTHFIVWLVN